MKKNNKAYRTGWIVLIIAIVAATLLGQIRKPQGGKYVVDNAGILGIRTEEAIGRYNNRWLDRWGVVAAVVTVDSADDIEDTAYDWADRLDLNDGCVILTISAGDGESICLWGYDLDGVMDARTVDKLTAITDQMMLTRDYDGCLANFFQLLDSNVYTAGLVTGHAGSGAPVAAVDTGGLFFLLLIFVVVLVLVLLAVEQSRFTTYRRTYYGVAGAPVFRPIFFWHVPGSRWYRRHWRPVPPPPPPRPPSGGGSFFGGSSHSSGGFHSSGPRSGGGFHSGGSSRSGGGFHAGGGFRSGGSFRSGGGFHAGGSSRSGGGFRGRR